ncbi:hypothetical protein N7508_003475 [Penicillium antarcticum]|uniref:uncharacterized protein n=1 Tax=Penicillium antarcticum TaxID=416450 RepID=UPI00239FD76C|nr:uncharacterized protein N7508_003475 [Penicillium antarcticum]KAJ5312645.1 hypothetical protein N7508_003475 [Penicillium antarcticum]
MAELYDAATQHGPQDIEELPPSVKVYHYKGMDDFCRVVSLEHNRLYSSSRAAQCTRARAMGEICEGRHNHLITLPQTDGTQSDHIIFIIQPSTFIQDFLNPITGHRFHGRISFSPKTNILVLKMALPDHSQATLAFEDTLKMALQQIDLHHAIFSWGNARLTGGDGTIKEADGGWSPRRPPRGAPKRPSVVLEIASSETSAKLRRDAHYWVDPARGQANMAIGVKVFSTNPQITIEQWEWNSQHFRAIQKACLTITKFDGKIRFDPDQPTPQLLIPFHLLFRRAAENNRERDIVFPTQDLVEFATVVWEMQSENLHA